MPSAFTTSNSVSPFSVTGLVCAAASAADVNTWNTAPVSGAPVAPTFSTVRPPHRVSTGGVTSWLPVYGPDGRVHGWTLDLMRRRPDGFRAVVEYLIASACKDFQAEGARFLSLSGAPLARTRDEESQPALDRLLDHLGALLEPYYGFRSLHAFKAKFQPRREPLYLAYRDEADLPRIGLALGRAYLQGSGLKDFAKLALRRQRVVGGGVVVDRSAAGTPR